MPSACFSIRSAALTGGVSSVARAVSAQSHRNLMAKANEGYFQNRRKYSFSAHAVPVYRCCVSVKPSPVGNSVTSRAAGIIYGSYE
jgi:hypothetical protein